MPTPPRLCPVCTDPVPQSGTVGHPRVYHASCAPRRHGHVKHERACLACGVAFLSVVGRYHLACRPHRGKAAA